MPVFTYQAVDANGKPVKGDVDARTQEEARVKIQKMNYFPTAIKPKGGAAAEAAAPGAIGHQVEIKAGALSFFGGRVSGKILAMFTTQMSTLQDAGLPLVRCLDILESQQRAGYFKKVLGQVREDVESGSTLSEAMARYPNVFDNLYTNMVKAGEAGGVLDTILRRLAEFMEKAQRLKRKLIGAMVYPIAVITVAALILTALMLIVVPKFSLIFEQMGIDLPLPTKILISTSTVFVSYWWTVIVGLVVLYIIYRVANRNEAFRFISDTAKLRMPLVGNVLKKSVIARFASTLGTLITSGVNILEALQISKAAIGNLVVSRAIEDVHDRLREGDSIADPLSKYWIFDDIVVNMIDVGEETGELDKMLMKIAENYNDEVDVAVEGMTSLLEPVMIVFLGLTIGFIIVSLFLPLIKLMGEIQS